MEEKKLPGKRIIAKERSKQFSAKPESGGERLLAEGGGTKLQPPKGLRHGRVRNVPRLTGGKGYAEESEKTSSHDLLRVVGRLGPEKVLVKGLYLGRKDQAGQGGRRLSCCRRRERGT